MAAQKSRRQRSRGCVSARRWALVYETEKETDPEQILEKWLLAIWFLLKDTSMAITTSWKCAVREEKPANI